LTVTSFNFKDYSFQLLELKIIINNTIHHLKDPVKIKILQQNLANTIYWHSTQYLFVDTLFVMNRKYLYRHSTGIELNLKYHLSHKYVLTDAAGTVKLISAINNTLKLIKNCVNEVNLEIT